MANESVRFGWWADLAVSSSRAGGMSASPPVQELQAPFIIPGRYGAVAQCAFLIIDAKHTEWKVQLLDLSATAGFKLLALSNGRKHAEVLFLDAGAKDTRVEIRRGWTAVLEDIESCPQR